MSLVCPMVPPALLQEPPICGALVLRGRAERRACSSSTDNLLRREGGGTPDRLATSNPENLATARDRFVPVVAADSSSSGALAPPAGPGTGSGACPSREASNPGAAEDRLRRVCAWYQSRTDSAEAELQALREGMKQLRSSTADLQFQVKAAEAKAAERESQAEAAHGRALELKLQLDDARSLASRFEAKAEASHAEAAAQRLWTEAAKAEATTQYLRAATAEEESVAYRSWVEAAKVMQENVAKANAEGEHLLQAKHAKHRQLEASLRRPSSAAARLGTPPRGSGGSSSGQPATLNVSRISEPEAEGQSRSQRWEMEYEDILVRRQENSSGLVEAAGSSPARPPRAPGPSPGSAASAGAGQLPPPMPQLSGAVDPALCVNEAQQAVAAAAARAEELEAQLARQGREAEEAVGQARAQAERAAQAAEAKCSELETQVRSAAARISDLSAQLGEQGRAAVLAKAESERSSRQVLELEAQLAQAEHAAQRTSELEAALKQAEASEGRAGELETELASMRMAMVEAVRQTAAEGTSRLKASEAREQELQSRLDRQLGEGPEAPHMRELEAARAGTVRAEAEAAEAREQAERSKAELEKVRGAAQVWREELLGELQAARREAQAASTRAKDLEASRGEAGAREAELLGRLEALQREASSREEELSAKLEALQREASSREEELSTKLEALQREASSREAELSTKLEAARAGREEALARAGGLEALAERLRSEQAEAAAQATKAREGAEKRASELEAKLEAHLVSQTEASENSKKEVEAAKRELEQQAEKQLAASKVALGKAQAEREQYRQALEAKTREFQSTLEQQRGAQEARLAELKEQLDAQRAEGERALGLAREEGEKKLRACEVRNRELGRQLAAVQDALSAESKATIKMSELAKELAQQRREVELQLASEVKQHTLRPNEGRQSLRARELEGLRHGESRQGHRSRETEGLRPSESRQSLRARELDGLRPSESRQSLRARELEGKCSARQDAKSLSSRRHTSAASVPNLPAQPSGGSRRQERPSSAGPEASLAATSRGARPRSAGPEQQLARSSLPEGGASPRASTLACSRSFSTGCLHAHPAPGGISVHHLSAIFLDEVYAAGLDRGATLHEVESCVLRALGANTRCTRDGRMGVSYLEMLHGEDNVGTATHFLSCCKGTSVGDLADALERYCRDAGLSPKRTYVWHGCFCMSARQRRGARSGRSGCTVCHGEKEDTFVADFTCRMRSIGKVLAVVAPWEEPLYMTNAGCVAEMFVALSLGSSCELNVLGSPADGERLAADLLNGGQGLVPTWQVLSSLRVEECQEGDAQEAEAVLRFVRSGPGAGQVDACVARRLHTWLAEEAEGQLRRLLASGELDGQPSAQLCDAVGWMLREVSLHDRASAMLQDGLQLSLRAGALGSDVPPRSTLLASVSAVGPCSGGGPAAGALRASEDAARQQHERMGTLESPAGLALLSSIGATKWVAGDRAGALEALLEAKRVRHDMGSLETVDGAVLLRNIGIVKWARGDHDGGLEAYAEARALYEKTGSLSTCGGVGLLLNIGFAKADCDDDEGSLEAFEEAKRIFEAHGTLEMPSGATLLTSIGAARGGRDDQAGALAAYQQARCIRERTGTMGSLAGAALLHATGAAHAAAGDRASALEAYTEAWDLREELGAQETPAGAGLLSDIALAKERDGNRPGALEASREARRIFECTGSLGSPGGQALAEHLAGLEETEDRKPLQ